MLTYGAILNYVTVQMFDRADGGAAHCTVLVDYLIPSAAY